MYKSKELAIVCGWLTKKFGGRIDILLLVSDKYTNMQICHRLRNTLNFFLLFFVFVFFFYANRTGVISQVTITFEKGFSSKNNVDSKVIFPLKTR